HIHIEGRVQGVGYRGWMMAIAQDLGLNGWVRNRLDGSVEACVEGEVDAIAKMLSLCHEGPMTSRVNRVTHEPTAEKIRPGFVQRPTG
ncbi:MAG: acylphosphatase, partial [Pseudomonadota bacterium]